MMPMTSTSVSCLRYVVFGRKEVTIRSVFDRSVRVAKATLGDVAKGLDRSPAALFQWRAGTLPVTEDAARRLVRYLRRRVRELEEAAEELERAIQRGEHHGT
jgi:hypothetical protein